MEDPLVSGYLPQYAYDLGRLDQSLPFAELERRALDQRPRSARARARIRRSRSASGRRRADSRAEAGPGVISRARRTEPRPRRNMGDLFETMHTMRAMRRLKPDPVPDALIRRSSTPGVRAERRGNTQRWRLLVIKDARDQDSRCRSSTSGRSTRWSGRAISTSAAAARREPRRPTTRQHAAVEYLTDHFHEAPVWIVACLEEGTAPPTRWSGASIYPAVQNMLLAARAAGLRRRR